MEERETEREKGNKRKEGNKKARNRTRQYRN